jgi:1,2-diacylglycerol 3-alpha-glucosyltransferase
MKTVAIIHNYQIHYQELLFWELKKQGLSFEVIFTASNSAERRDPPLQDLNGYASRVGFDGPYEAAPQCSTIRYVWSSLSAVAPRIVIIGGYCDVAAWTAWVWAEVHRVPRLLWAESNYFDHRRTFWKERLKMLFVNRCRGAHVYGASNREYLVKLGMPSTAIESKRAVLNTRLFRPSDTPAAGGVRPLKLLYVGRFAPEKNLEFLLRAFADVTHRREGQEVVLELVGFGPSEPDLRRLAVDLGVETQVRFLGFMKQGQLPALYHSADIFILPSIREPWGLVVLEAMASGLPVLVSNRCGCVQDLVNQETGWTFDPFDLSALIRLLGHVAKVGKSSLLAMGQSATTIASCYAVESCARSVIGTVESALGTTGKLMPLGKRSNTGSYSPSVGARSDGEWKSFLSLEELVQLINVGAGFPWALSN